jgi:hypothetical protein
LSTEQAANLTTNQLKALTATQIVALETADLAALTSAQIVGIELTDLALLTTDQIKGLTVAGPLTGLNADQVKALTGTQIANMTTTQIAGFTTSQISAIDVADISRMGTAQINALTSDQLSKLTAFQVQALTTSQIVAIDTADYAGLTSTFIQALTDVSLQALTTSQLQAMDSSHMAALLPLQVSALTTAQIMAIDAADFAGFTTTQLAAIEVRDISIMTTAQLGQLKSTLSLSATNFSDAQINAMSTAQYASATPLVLDLGNDGIHTTALSDGVQFDLLGSGNRIPTGWVGPQDGLLVRDLNRNGFIDSGAELFGSSTMLSNGEKAVDGFQALAALDNNQDGLIDAADHQFTNLMVWQDVNQDGLSQEDELHSLEDLSIQSLSLGFTPVSQDDAGNWIGLESSYQTTDEEIHKLVDVWFKLN